MENKNFRTEILTNCVKEDALRYYVTDIVGKISEILSKSYGPFGSHTLLKNGDLSTKIYTKDGKTILDNIKMTGEISEFVLNEFKSITNYIASNVGDATTTVVLLSNLILQEIFCLKAEPTGGRLDLENSILNKYPSSYIIDAINKVSGYLKDIIIKEKQEFNSEKAYYIAYTASNGNKEISQLIKDIYDEYGSDIYLEPKYSLNGKEEVRVFDGTTLDYPMLSPIFINNNEGNCTIDNPKIYFFKDAIDTKEMIECVATIINENIIRPIELKSKIPTVIIAPRFSRDFDIEFAKFFKNIENLHTLAKPPLCFIEADHDLTGLDDIRNLSGATFIAKYLTSDNKIDYNNIKMLNEKCGTCEKIIIDGSKTMFKGIASKERFKEVIDQLKLQIVNEEKKMNPNHSHISNYKKRISKLTSQVVEIYIESISTSDKCNKFLVYEDVCTSVMNAAKNGVGRAALFELYNACNKLNLENYNEEYNSLYHSILLFIKNSVTSLVGYLLRTSKEDDRKINEVLYAIPFKEMPYNIITNEYDANLLTTIMSDIEILSSISIILSNLITTNQMLISSDVEALSYNNISNK